MHKPLRSFYFPFPILFLLPIVGYAQTADITGVVVDGSRKTPLAGAQIEIAALSLSASSDARGEFRLLRVPQGTHSVSVSYLGYTTLTRDIAVEPGRAVLFDVEMAASLATSVTVVGDPILEGQARALNEQKAAINIKNIVAADQIGRFPDPNAAEATQRVPGVSLQRDQGEGRYVSIRGASPRLNGVMINGERIPSPEGDVRQVALDVIPADLLESIEVSKALTADMDADSIGGAVNLVTKTAPDRRRFSLTAGGGLNELTRGPIRIFNGTYADRFLRDKKLGLVLSTSYMKTERGSNNFEQAFDDGVSEELELRDYSVNRTRFGFNGNLDYKFNRDNILFARGIYNDFGDQEFRRQTIYKFGDGEIERAVRDRFEEQNIQSISGGGRHYLPNSWSIDYRLTYSFAEENEPKARAAVFLAEDIDFRPNLSDPDRPLANPLNDATSRYALDELTSDRNYTSDREWVGQFNAAAPFRLSNGAGNFKFGVKVRDRVKLRTNRADEFSFDDDVPLSRWLDPSFNGSGFYQGKIPFPGDAPDPRRLEALAASADESERDPEIDAENFDANERISAGYAMTELFVSDRLTIVPGFRFENSRVRYRGFNVAFDEDGDYVGTQPIDGRNNFTSFLPSLHIRYRLDDNTNVRAAYTRSLGRPNFSDLVPFRLFFPEDREIVRGNANLVATTSDNFDVLFERYFTTVGVVSAGFFHKSLARNIFTARFREQVDGRTFDVFQPLNGQSARLTGVEAAYQNQLRFLPGFLKYFGVYSNYTFVNSSAILPDGRRIRLPEQVDHTGNAAVSFEYKGFSARSMWNLQSRSIAEVGESEELDFYFDNRVQWDISVMQRLTKNIRVYADFLNLTNAPYRVYEGSPNRPIQREIYSFWGIGGLKFDF